MYATLAAGGVRRAPYAIDRVVFPDGEEEKTEPPDGERVLDGRPGPGRRGGPRAQRPAGHRPGGADRLRGRRQDRHDRRLPRRLAGRLDARPRDGGVGRLPGPLAHARRARDRRVRRHVPGAHLGPLHGRRDGRGLQAAARARRGRAGPRAVLRRPRDDPEVREGRGGGGDADADGHAGADADADADPGGHADADADPGADADAHADAEEDPDADAHPAEDRHPGTEEDADADTDAGQDAGGRYGRRGRRPAADADRPGPAAAHPAALRRVPLLGARQRPRPRVRVRARRRRLPVVRQPAPRRRPRPR